MTAQPQQPTPQRPSSDYQALVMLLAKTASSLERIADALDRMAIASAPAAPDYRRSLAEYPGFDWSTIGAQVIAGDEFGPTTLEQGGYQYTRRSPQNKFGEAIWYSRPLGRDAEGKVKYARLITFTKPAEAEPVPGRVARAVGEAMERKGQGGQPQGIAPTPTPTIAPTAPPKTQAAQTGQAQGTAPTAPTKPSQTPPPPAPEAPRAIAKGEKDVNKIAAALGGGATMDDVLAALNGSNGPALFWTACRNWLVSKPLTDRIVHEHTDTNRITNWGGALAALKDAIAADPF